MKQNYGSDRGCGRRNAFSNKLLGIVITEIRIWTVILDLHNIFILIEYFYILSKQIKIV